MSVISRVGSIRGDKLPKRVSRRGLDILKRAQKRKSMLKETEFLEDDDEETEFLEDDESEAVLFGKAFLIGGSMFTDAENEILLNEACKQFSALHKEFEMKTDD